MPQPPASKAIPGSAQLQVKNAATGAVTDPSEAFALSDDYSGPNTLTVVALFALVFVALAVGIVLRSSRQIHGGSAAVKLVDGIEGAELEDADVSTARSHLIKGPYYERSA
jgi:hypothetical protein